MKIKLRRAWYDGEYLRDPKTDGNVFDIKYNLKDDLAKLPSTAQVLIGNEWFLVNDLRTQKKKAKPVATERVAAEPTLDDLDETEEEEAEVKEVEAPKGQKPADPLK